MSILNQSMGEQRNLRQKFACLSSGILMVAVDQIVACIDRTRSGKLLLTLADEKGISNNDKLRGQPSAKVG